MATAPTNPNLPMFYGDLVPLNSQEHGALKVRPLDTAKFLVNCHAVPLTSDEFIGASRFYPIIFTQGENPVPLALMAMNEGMNTFVDDDGKLLNPVYVPAYIRRYPFMFVRAQPDSDEMTLCFDPTAEAVGTFEDGEPLFDGDAPSQATQDILSFCQSFEESGLRTGQFMEELKSSGLLMDGEVGIQVAEQEQPFTYRGFQMVDENKLRELRGDVLRKMVQNGMLPLIYAHLFSLQLMRELFAQQVAMGKMPQVTQAPTAGA
jgi:hypothetical protein